MQFTKFLALAALSVSSLVATSEARAQTKMAVIDMQKAINETNEGARANDTLKKLFDKRQVELNAKQDELLKEKGSLERRCRSLPPAQCQSSAEELQKKLVDLQNLMMQYQQDIQKRQGEATQPILAKMLTIVGRIARQSGYDMVVDRAAVHFMADALDVTAQAIKIYNTESNVAPLPPEAPKTDKSDKAPKKPAKK